MLEVIHHYEIAGFKSVAASVQRKVRIGGWRIMIVTAVGKKYATMLDVGTLHAWRIPVELYEDPRYTKKLEPWKWSACRLLAAMQAKRELLVAHNCAFARKLSTKVLAELNKLAAVEISQIKESNKIEAETKPEPPDSIA